MVIIYDDVEIALATLASKDAIAANSKIDSSRLNGFRIVKVEYWLDFSGKTATEGPIMVGFTPHLGAADVEAAIEADPQSGVDRDEIAIGKQPVFPLELIPAAQDTNTDGTNYKGSFNPRWSCPEGFNASWWAYNMDGSALTTGTVIRIFAKIYGVDLRD